MAVTFEIKNGDVVESNITGRPNLIGNVIGEDVIGKSKAKTSQDLQRCLSIGRLRDGSGAGITDLVGTLEGGGFASISIMLKARIRSMFTAIQALQRKRLTVRPSHERFSSITTLIVTQQQDRTSYKFRLDARTVGGTTIVQSGIIQR